MEVKEISITEQRTYSSGVFPFVCSPTSQDISLEQVFAWVKSKKEWIEGKMAQHGAVLLRGFPVASVQDFDDLICCFDYQPLQYLGGAAPRKQITQNVFTANEAPPDQAILFHHEMAYLPVSPKGVVFYCHVAPPKGGETPIIPSHELYNNIRAKIPAFVDKLETVGVRYFRLMAPEDNSESYTGSSWKKSLGATKEEAEKKCEEVGLSFEWIGESLKTGNKTTSWPIKVHEKTSQKIWFNAIAPAFNRKETDVKFADGTEITKSDYTTIVDTMYETCVAFKWQKGDVLLLDNSQVLHGRNPFAPPREIYAWLVK